MAMAIFRRGGVSDEGALRRQNPVHGLENVAVLHTELEAHAVRPIFQGAPQGHAIKGEGQGDLEDKQGLALFGVGHDRLEVLDVHPVLGKDAGNGGNDLEAILAVHRDDKRLAFLIGEQATLFKRPDGHGQEHVPVRDGGGQNLFDNGVIQPLGFPNHKNGRELPLENGLAHFLDIAFQPRQGTGNQVHHAGAIQPDDRNNDFVHLQPRMRVADAPPPFASGKDVAQAQSDGIAGGLRTARAGRSRQCGQACMSMNLEFITC